MSLQKGLISAHSTAYRQIISAYRDAPFPAFVRFASLNALKLLWIRRRCIFTSASPSALPQALLEKHCRVLLSAWIVLKLCRDGEGLKQKKTTGQWRVGFFPACPHSYAVVVGGKRVLFAWQDLRGGDFVLFWGFLLGLLYRPLGGQQYKASAWDFTGAKAGTGWEWEWTAERTFLSQMWPLWRQPEQQHHLSFLPAKGVHVSLLFRTSVNDYPSEEKHGWEMENSCFGCPNKIC